ncbi:MAG: protein kinase, partial [Paucibacter sp.]|nr:protein kinase [Roseateles sp.]
AEASAAQREAVARIEVRAFGCLLEELLARCEEASPQSLRALLTLRDACLAEDAAQRPSWPSIIRSLESQAF